MKRRPSPAKELSLARKRALIRSLMEQAVSTGVLAAPRSMTAVAAATDSAAIVIPFPAPGK
jgi:hypothetical protein